MNSSSINEEIIKFIREKSKGDKSVEKFLIDLLSDEISHPGTWHWKKLYRKKIEEYSKMWRNDSENK